MFRHPSLPATARVLALVASLCASGALPAQQPTAQAPGTESPSPTAPAANDQTVVDTPAAPTMPATGACHITAHSVTNCTAAMTQRACLAVAQKVGGVAQWVQGGQCP